MTKILINKFENIMSQKTGPDAWFIKQSMHITPLQVSKALHAAEGQEKQARQHAASLKSAAYAAQALAGKK